MRHTAEYRSALLGGTFQDFSDEERLQLENGDIPYFFTIHPNPTLLYFSKRQKISPVMDQTRMRQKATTKWLCSPERLRKIEKVTALQMLRRFWTAGEKCLKGTMRRP
ncbi:MAG: hypothetical protein HC902_03755 [Calothrix sp. SM1_5_4]|nr:hypothetical protein [Calothrix sp. SM1_5_4]